LWRIDQPVHNAAQNANQFRYVADGTGVNVYIIDSGVYVGHHEFTGRIHVVGNFVDHPTNPQPTDDVSDCAADGTWEGHGTHNASYAAGTQAGVAKNAQIWVLKAADAGCNGTEAALVAAVDWIKNNGQHPGVINISFDVTRFSGNILSHILAATNPPAPQRGFLFTLSAGGGGPVDTRFGAVADSAIVAAVTDRDDNAGQSDYGPKLALFAPGIATTSAACCARGPDAYHVATVGLPGSGAECSPSCDSYAAPVAAGVAAVYLQRHPSATPSQVQSAIIKRAASGQVKNAGTSTNLLLQTARDYVVDDYDADGKTDIALFRPSTAMWYLHQTTAGDLTLGPYGSNADIPLPGDYDGDGKTDIAVFRPSTAMWYISYSSGGNLTAGPFGGSGDIPLVGDYDGDGKTDIAVFRPSTGMWYISYSSGGSLTAGPFGGTGDIPLVGDYDGDGKTDIAVFRPSTAMWNISYSSGGNLTFGPWGSNGDIPLVGDYDGDGKTDIAVFHPSTAMWYVNYSSGGSLTFGPWGSTGDIPLLGDYDRDGKTDIAVFRPSTAVWYINQSSGAGQVTFGPWGGTGDIPLSMSPSPKNPPQ